MNSNHHTLRPAPSSLCVIYKPQVALLALGKLDEAQANDVRAHIADCAYCQTLLREYDIVREGIARTFGAAASTEGKSALRDAPARPAAATALSPITLEDIMRAADKPPTIPVDRPAPVRQISPRRRWLTAIGAIAAVLVVAIFATLLFTNLNSRTPTRIATPVPSPRPTAIPTWATAGPSTLKGTITEFNIPTKGANPNYIVGGPDGNVWFTEAHANKIGRSTPQGAITEFGVPTPNAGLTAIAAGPDGNLWFTESAAGKIGRITPQGNITEYAIPTAGAKPLYITAGPDGNAWFTEAHANKIGKITPQGAITEFGVPTPNAGLSGITTGVDGNLWFAEYNTTIIGRITPHGAIKEFDAKFHNPNPPAGTTFPAALPNQPVLLARAADGVWWNYAENGIGYMTPDGKSQVLYTGQWGATPKDFSTCPVTSNTFAGNLWTAPDGAVWGWLTCWISRLTVTPDGFSTYGTPSTQFFHVPQALDAYSGLVLAPMADGTVWFVGQSPDQIGRLS